MTAFAIKWRMNRPIRHCSFRASTSGRHRCQKMSLKVKLNIAVAGHACKATISYANHNHMANQVLKSLANDQLTRRLHRELTLDINRSRQQIQGQRITSL